MPIFRHHGYDLVPMKPMASDLTVSQDAANTNHRRRRSWNLVAIVALAMLALTGAGLFYKSKHHLTVRTGNLPFKPCGKTPEEAIAAGCKFDVMMDSWLPERCYDDELTQEFRTKRDWTFVETQNKSVEISEETLSRRADAFTTLEYHVSHCAFALRKLHRAIEQDRQIEVDVASQKHTQHCADHFQMFMWRQEEMHRMKAQAFSIEMIGTPLHPSYPECMWARDILGRDVARTTASST